MDADWRSLLLEWQNEDGGDNPQHEQPNLDSFQAACVYSRSEGASRFPERLVQHIDPFCRVAQPVLTSNAIDSGDKEPLSVKTGGTGDETAHSFPQKPPEQFQHKLQYEMSEDIVKSASAVTIRTQRTNNSSGDAAPFFPSQVSEERAFVPQQPQWRKPAQEYGTNVGSANPAADQHFSSLANTQVPGLATQEFREYILQQEQGEHQQQPQLEIQTIRVPAKESVMQTSNRPFVINGQDTGVISFTTQRQAPPLQSVVPASLQIGLDSSLVMCPEQIPLIVLQLQIQQQLLHKQHQEILRLSENVPALRVSPRIAPQAPDPKCESVKKGKRIRDANLPKRPLTAYNLFFKHERARMLGEAAGADTFATSKEAEAWNLGAMSGKGHGAELVTHKSQKVCDHRHQRPRVGFAEMAQRVAAKWKNLDERTREQYKEAADHDKERYMREKAAYLASKESETKNLEAEK